MPENQPDAYDELTARVREAAAKEVQRFDDAVKRGARPAADHLRGATKMIGPKPRPGVLAAFTRWLWDFPRPTWEVPTGEGLICHLSRKTAREIHAAEAEAAAECGETAEPVQRGPWMRPSEIDALPEV